MSKRGKRGDGTVKERIGSSAGEMVSWDCAALTVTREQVSAALEQAGFDKGYARKLHMGDAATRACRTLKKGRVIKPVKDPSLNPKKTIRFQFTREHLAELEGDQGYTFKFETFLDVDVETGVISPHLLETDRNDSEKVEEAERLAGVAQRELARASSERTGRDLNRLIQRLFHYESRRLHGAEAHCFSLRSNGCFYFVSKAHIAFLDQMDEFLQKLGRRLDRISVNSDPKTMATLTVAVEEGCQEMLERHILSIKSFTETTRPGIMQRHLQSLTESRLALEGYAEFLGGRREALLEKLASLQTGLQVQLDKRLAALEAERVDEEDDEVPPLPEDAGDKIELVSVGKSTTERMADDLEDGLFLLPLD